MPIKIVSVCDRCGYENGVIVQEDPTSRSVQNETARKCGFHKVGKHWLCEDCNDVFNKDFMKY